MENKFNIQRVIKFTSYIINNDRKSFIISPLITFLGVLFINLIADAFIYINKPELTMIPSFIQTKCIIWVFSCFGVVTMIHYMPSKVQGFLSQKGRFARYMMLPISESERFAAMSLLNYIVFPIVLSILVIAAMATALLPEMIIFPNLDVNMYYESLCNYLTFEYGDLLKLACGISSYSLGAYFWHKNAFAKTFCTWFLFFFILGCVAFYVHKNTGNNLHLSEYGITPELLSSIGLILFGSLSWIAYKKRSVINRTK